MIKKPKEQGVAVINEEARAELRQSYPVEQTYHHTFFPRLRMVSQDKTQESKNPKTGKKELTIVAEAGEFYTERKTDEVDDQGKTKWELTQHGDTIEGVILYERKQLSYYDSANNTFTNSPIYDDAEEVVPLFSGGKEVDRGTAKELKSRPQYAGKTAAGKPKSNLADVRILYVLFDGEVYQMNIQGSSGYAFLKYKRDIQFPNEVVTKFGSEAKENGSIRWNQMTFTRVRALEGELDEVLGYVRQIRDGVTQEKAYFATLKPEIVVNELPDDNF